MTTGDAWPSSARLPTKEDCPGCVALVDAIGRFKPGFCHPTDCLMAKERAKRRALKGRLAGAEYE